MKDLLQSPRTRGLLVVCYMCRQQFDPTMFASTRICHDCSELNYRKASQYMNADMQGRVALVTGGRIKIGYQVVLQLLRAGCTVVVTTRFPHEVGVAGFYLFFVCFCFWSWVILGIDWQCLPSWYDRQQVGLPPAMTVIFGKKDCTSMDLTCGPCHAFLLLSTM